MLTDSEKSSGARSANTKRIGGTHILVDMYGCNYDRLNNPLALQYCMTKAAENAGAAVLGTKYHWFAPQGVTGVVLLSESHLSIHTWPESNFATLDVFTCGSIDTRAIVREIENWLKSEAVIEQEVERGDDSICALVKGQQ
jgi:S-adenosylmethionine decarboxylase proenzyme